MHFCLRYVANPSSSTLPKPQLQIQHINGKHLAACVRFWKEGHAGHCRHDFMDTWMLPISVLTVTFNRAVQTTKTAAIPPKGHLRRKWGGGGNKNKTTTKSNQSKNKPKKPNTKSQKNNTHRNKGCAEQNPNVMKS